MVQYSTGNRSRQPAAPLSASDATSPTVSGIAAICDQVSLHLPRLAGRGDPVSPRAPAEVLASQQSKRRSHPATSVGAR
ncbi:hypothetical protein VFPFJ_05421 [Purpureocillium lilacinum]|uniref:Uncharacterized protein n=1 Tax=Purpureocillium lilacinum TaxID=33203 RepID=A0A179HN08_PURLI|nr:hypothetical protein VFPFJ_05421 [Purpureocillium lilacinum]OAQ91262.1 hypothetical protein VFPFJ_05421 [Purpureocillium lilacinum]